MTPRLPDELSECPADCGVFGPPTGDQISAAGVLIEESRLELGDGYLLDGLGRLAMGALPMESWHKWLCRRLVSP